MTATYVHDGHIKFGVAVFVPSPMIDALQRVAFRSFGRPDHMSSWPYQITAVERDLFGLPLPEGGTLAGALQGVHGAIPVQYWNRIDH